LQNPEGDGGEKNQLGQVTTQRQSSIREEWEGGLYLTTRNRRVWEEGKTSQLRRKMGPPTLEPIRRIKGGVEVGTGGGGRLPDCSSIRGVHSNLSQGLIIDREGSKKKKLVENLGGQRERPTPPITLREKERRVSILFRTRR